MIFFGFISLWMLYSLDSDRPLESDELRSILSLHTRLDHVLCKLRSLWTKLRKLDVFVMCFVLLLYIFWPSFALRLYCYYSVLGNRANRHKFYCRRNPAYYLYERLVRNIMDPRLTQLAPVALMAFGCTLIVVYVGLLHYTIWVCRMLSSCRIRANISVHAAHVLPEEAGAL